MSRAWGDASQGQGPRVTREDLVAHLGTGFKSPDRWLLGMEHEKLGVDAEGRALRFQGPGGVEEVLGALDGKDGLEARREEGHIVGLEGEGLAGLSLEPGAQIEFISAPRKSLRELEEDICGHLGRVLQAGGNSRNWLALGLQPVTPLKEMEWISRERYRIMARHMSERGDLAHRMMTQTAGVQLNVDYESDEDVASKMRTAMGITSFITAAFANSPFYAGESTGWVSYRSHIWTRTDPTRCGLIRAAVEGDGMDRDAWVKYALEVPAMFIVREGRYLPLEGVTFGQFMEHGYEDFHPDLSDWELHLTTLFPEVRLKTYMEVRGIDGVDRKLALAGVALWKGILYSPEACSQAWELVSDFSWEERLALHEEAGLRGTRGRFRKRALGEWIEDLVRIAEDGLRDPDRAVPAEGEGSFLDPLREQLEERGGSPGWELIERWEGEWNRDPSRLVAQVALTPCRLLSA